MTPRRNTERGITLIELMVVAVILGLVIGIFFKVLVTGSSQFASQQRLADTQAQGRYGMGFVAYDAQTAGWSGTPNCELDPRIIDDADSCTPFENGLGGGNFNMQSLRFDDAAIGAYGAGAAANPQFAPDELWILSSPFPGQAIRVDAMNGTALIFRPATWQDVALVMMIGSSPVLAIDDRERISLRQGPPVAAFAPGGGPGADYTLNLVPAPSDARGFGGNEVEVTALNWVRYRILPDPEDTSGFKTDLVREVYSQPGLPAIGSSVIASDVIDFQVTFCLDTSYVMGGAPAAPVLLCNVTAEALVNNNPERVRTATLVVRTRSQSDELNAFADPDYALQWYDIDGNPVNGVARVRTMSRTVSFPNNRS